MKKIKVITVLILSLTTAILLTACKESKYRDFREVMEKQKNIQDKFISGIDNAENPALVARSLSDYSKSMMELEPLYQELEKKYPNLEEIPAELDDLNKALMEQGEVISSRISEKILKYSEDPAVAEEFKNFVSPQAE